MNRKLFLTKLICAVVFWSINTAASAQNGGVYTFHWGSEDYGLIFDSTNLTGEVKMSIAHDIEQVFGRIPTAGSTFTPLPVTHPDFGKYTGNLSVTNFFIYWPDVFIKQFGRYQMLNGTNHFIISETLGTCYQTKINLTNSYAIAASSFSNFYSSVSGLTTNAASVALFKQIWWSLNSDSVFEWGDGRGELVLEEIDELAKHEFYYPSVLDFRDSWRGRTEFICVIRIAKRTTQEITQLGFIYKSGQWRLVAFDGA